MTEPIVVHLILNSHIDPVWLWPWEAGLDSVLATCRSACDLLDRRPNLVFTRGEAWAYRMVQTCDPALFARIRRHIDAGRWEVVGGWWIQPDCNAPTLRGMERQIELGLEYFEKELGLRPRVAYNVDSFGHAAALPSLMRRYGQDRYVMMRPQEHERELPARLFRWSGEPDGPQVTTFRIAGAYACSPHEEHIERSWTELPAGVRHTMCFVGVGDHGGGPTERDVQWLEERMEAWPGVRLEFSSPSRFFDAVAAQQAELPEVVGELQMHAVGCYSVHRPIKIGVRSAEKRLSQAEAGGCDGLDEAWRRVCFAQFHDTLGGTCIPSAYAIIEDGLGGVRADADEKLHVAFRQKLAGFRPDLRQRIVVWNASAKPFEGFLEHEPWIESAEPPFRLLEASGEEVPTQGLQCEPLFWNAPRLLWKASMAPDEIREFFLVGGEPARAESSFELAFEPPILHSIPDESDTWSHGVSSYSEEPTDVSDWGSAERLEEGLLRWRARYRGRVGASSLTLDVRHFPGESFWEAVLEVDWREKHRILKWILPSARGETERWDGVMGGVIRRANDGVERPIQDAILFGEHRVVCPDVFAADATPARLRLTLLRSSILAHHLPHSGESPLASISDQGKNRFRFRFYSADALWSELEQAANGMQCPPLLADWTFGMPRS